MTRPRSRRHPPSFGEPAAGNGILSRRVFLESAVVAGTAGAGISTASAEPLAIENWMKEPGTGFAPYGQPSRFEDKVVRAVLSPPNPPLPGVGTARTPLHLLEGIITPSGLHFERSHSGIPDIDPDQHRLAIHGLVRTPKLFTMDDLLRLPSESRIHFLECSGNTGNEWNGPSGLPVQLQPSRCALRRAQAQQTFKKPGQHERLRRVAARE